MFQQIKFIPYLFSEKPSRASFLVQVEFTRTGEEAPTRNGRLLNGRVLRSAETQREREREFIFFPLSFIHFLFPNVNSFSLLFFFLCAIFACLCLSCSIPFSKAFLGREKPTQLTRHAYGTEIAEEGNARRSATGN